MKYLLPLAAAGALLYALSGYGCNRHDDMKSSAPAPAKVEKPASAPAAAEKPASAPAASEKAAPAVPGIDLASATSAIEALKSALGGVKDEATAKSSLPKLQDLAGQFDKLKGLAMGLPADARHPLVVMISGVMPGLASSITRPWLCLALARS